MDTNTQDFLALLPREAAERYRMVVLGREGNTLKVGMTDPNNIESQDALRFILNRHNLQGEVYKIKDIDLELQH